jgi:hypothetical protein
MSTRILYDSSNKVAGKMLAKFVDSLKEALAEGRRVKAVLDAAQSGAPADWAAVAAELGLPATQAGADAAQAAWTIASNAMTAIDVAAVVELARLDQG